MKQCPSCRAEIDDDARFCIFCAESVDEKRHIEIRRFGVGSSLRAVIACVCAAVIVLTVTVGAMTVRRNSAPPRLPEPESETAVTVSAVPEQPQEDTRDESTEPAGAVTDATDTPFAPADETTDTDAAGTPAADTSPADVPETTEPETTKPETTKPEATAPDTTRPETTRPETTKPETTAPVTTARETTPPETTAQETTPPETTANTTAAETTAPETTSLPSDAVIFTKAGSGFCLTDPDEFYQTSLKKPGPIDYGGSYDDADMGKPHNFEKVYSENGWEGYNYEYNERTVESRVYFRSDGRAIAGAMYHTNWIQTGVEPDLRFLYFALGIVPNWTFERVFNGSSKSFIEYKFRPSDWRGLMKENGIYDDPITPEYIKNNYPNVSGFDILHCDTREFYVKGVLPGTGEEKLIRITIDHTEAEVVPETPGVYCVTEEGADEDADGWWYGEMMSYFFIAEYVD